MDEGIIDTMVGPDMALSEIFYTRNNKGHTFRVKLDSRGFTLQPETASSKKQLQTVNLNDIVGSKCLRLNKARLLKSTCGSCHYSSCSTGANKKNSKDLASTDSDCSAYLYVFAYVLRKKLRNNVRRERTVLTLRFRSFDNFDDNMQEAERWCSRLKWYKYCYEENKACKILNGIEGRHKKLLILLNPKSGPGKARSLFHKQVAPILNEAEVTYDLFVTQHANYAHEFVRLRNLSAWSCVVAVGGDGIFFEILNGVFKRADWEDILGNMSFGIVPCGSGNGLARSIAHIYREPYEPKPVQGAVLAIVSGKIAPFDVVRIELKNKIIYSFLSVGWGLISDIDIESESLRPLGYQRFTLWTLHRLINLRTYSGRVSYLATTEKNSITTQNALKPSRSYNTNLNKTERCNYYQSAECIASDVEFEDVISLETSVRHSLRSRCDSWFSVGSRKSTYYSVADSIYRSIATESDLMNTNDEAFNIRDHNFGKTHGPKSTMPSLQDPLPDCWTIEEGEFVMVHAAYQTHLGTDCFFAPMARLNDGIIYLVIIRAGISRKQLFHFLINMSSGTHLDAKNNDYIKVVAVVAFRIEPHANNGIITVDGECVEFGALQAEIVPGIANVMVPK